MKTRLITTVIAFVFLSINLQAENGNNTNKTHNKAVSIEQQISNNIQYPDFVRLPMNLEEIQVKFTVTDNFELKIKEVVSTSDKLKDYVTKQLDNLKLNTDSTSINKNYSIRLIFK